MENINTEKQQTTCFKYSEQELNLKELLKELNISVEIVGIEKYFQGDKDERIKLNVQLERGKRKINFNYGLSLMDTWKYQFLISICSGINFEKLINKEIEQKNIYFFNFDSSSQEERNLLHKIYNTNKPYNFIDGNGKLKSIGAFKGLFQNLLYCILSSISFDYFCPIDFDDFCDEYGFNKDSIKDKKTWENCLKQAAKLQKIFSEYETECLPK